MPTPSPVGKGRNLWRDTNVQSMALNSHKNSRSFTPSANIQTRFWIETMHSYVAIQTREIQPMVNQLIFFKCWVFVMSFTLLINYSGSASCMRPYVLHGTKRIKQVTSYMDEANTVLFKLRQRTSGNEIQLCCHLVSLASGPKSCVWTHCKNYSQWPIRTYNLRMHEMK